MAEAAVNCWHEDHVCDTVMQHLSLQRALSKDRIRSAELWCEGEFSAFRDAVNCLALISMGTFLELSLEPEELFSAPESVSFSQERGGVEKGIDYLDLVVVQSAVDERLGGAVNLTVWDVKQGRHTFSESHNERAAVCGGVHDLEVVNSLQLDVVKEVDGVRVVTHVEEGLWNGHILEDRLEGDVWVLDANGGEG